MEHSFYDRLSVIPEEIRPEEVRERIANASQGYIGPLQELYMLMETDARYFGYLKQLRSAVTACPVKAVQSRNKSRGSKRALKLIQEQYAHVNVPRMIRQLVRPYDRGMALWRPLWTIEHSKSMGGDAVWFHGLENVSSTRLLQINDPTSDHNGELGVTSIDYPNGRPLSTFQEGSILLGLDPDAEQGYYDLAGAARACLGWWLAKNYTKTFWSEHNQTHGEPIRTAFVPPDIGDDELKKLEKFMRHLGRYMYGIFDEDVEIELQNSVNTGTVSTYQQMIAMANDEMAIATVGQVQTSDGGRDGSYAKAAVQYKVQRLIVVSIVQMVASFIRELDHMICKFNLSEDFDPADLPDHRPFVPRPEDKETLVKFYDMATKIMPVKASQIREDLELEIIDDDDEETIGPEDRAKGDKAQTEEQHSDSAPPTEPDRKARSVGSEAGDKEPSASGQVSPRGQLGLFAQTA